MTEVAKFEKVSLEEFARSIKLQFGEQFSAQSVQKMYDKIKLPRRATTGSAGYDFFSPFYFFLPSWGDITIPTGIKVRITKGWFLQMHPRSGSGNKHYLRLAGTTGIIDSDYYGNENNEGHIFAKLRKESGLRDTSTPSPDIEFMAGEAYCQGIFLPFGITEDDDADGERIGGFGSTDNK